MTEAIPILVCMAIGAVIGLATIPWKHRLFPTEGTATYILLWALLWPFLVLWQMKALMGSYIKRWHEYNAYQDYKKSTKKNDSQH